ncbi:MAG: hypothetical protein J5800_01875 [Spirochaetales bacterium]|nr:hypothetical protein [Spirochaetales bacterium]
MTARKIRKFFINCGKFEEDGNRTFWAYGHKVGYVMFNKSLIIVRDLGTEYPELLQMQSFKDIDVIADIGKGIYVGSRHLTIESKNRKNLKINDPTSYVR